MYLGCRPYSQAKGLVRSSSDTISIYISCIEPSMAWEGVLTMLEASTDHTCEDIVLQLHLGWLRSAGLQECENT